MLPCWRAHGKLWVLRARRGLEEITAGAQHGPGNRGRGKRRKACIRNDDQVLSLRRNSLNARPGDSYPFTAGLWKRPGPHGLGFFVELLQETGNSYKTSNMIPKDHKRTYTTYDNVAVDPGDDIWVATYELTLESWEPRIMTAVSAEDHGERIYFSTEDVCRSWCDDLNDV